MESTTIAVAGKQRMRRMRLVADRVCVDIVFRLEGGKVSEEAMRLWDKFRSALEWDAGGAWVIKDQLFDETDPSRPCEECGERRDKCEHGYSEYVQKKIVGGLDTEPKEVV